MAKRGRKLDLDRRRQAAALRAGGAPLSEIGRQLGVSKQRAHALARDVDGAAANRCRRCRGRLTDRPLCLRHTGSTYCLTCLEKHPKVSFGQRLRTCRVAAGLRLLELAERSGVSAGSLIEYEKGMRDPSWRTLGKLVRVLGVGLILVEEPRADADACSTGLTFR